MRVKAVVSIERTEKRERMLRRAPYRVVSEAAVRVRLVIGGTAFANIVVMSSGFGPEPITHVPAFGSAGTCAGLISSG
jgi:hypothetical protein